MRSEREILGDNLQKYINMKGIDQRILADYLGVSEMAVSYWINGTKYPRIGNIQKMADYFNIMKSDLIEDKSIVAKEDGIVYSTKPNQYTYFPTAISAGLPLSVDGITKASKISISDEVLGKHANDKDLYFARANGDSMDKLFKDGSLLAIKPITLDNLKNGDIVVFSDNHEYSVKHYHKYGNTLVFTPNSKNTAHKEQEYSINDNITIHGKVVTYIVNLD